MTANSLSKMACFSRLFHTGDIGFICPKSGNLYVTGRLDDVVKVNGVKVSVGNVDQILAGLDRSSGKFASLGATVTLALEKGETGTRLVCFYNSGDDDTFTHTDLAEALRAHFTTFLNVTFVKVSITTCSIKLNPVSHLTSQIFCLEFRTEFLPINANRLKFSSIL